MSETTVVNVVIKMTEKALATIVGLQGSQGSQMLIGVLADIADKGITEIVRQGREVPQYTHVHDALATGGVKAWLDHK